MALVTRCPDCATCFRVTPQQLQAHAGDVRCGYCFRVFNGFASLTTMQLPEAQAEPAIPATPSTSEAAAPSETPAISTTPAPDEPPTAGSSTATTPATPSAVVPAAPAKAPTTLTPDSAESPRTSPAPAYAFDAAPPRKIAWGWGGASLFLLIVLAGQMIHLYRTELFVALPGARPYLAQYCELLQCATLLPRQVELLSIESSDLQADPGRPGGMRLTASVRNRAPFPQALPAFMLTLTDLDDQPLASRNFTAREYLGQNADSVRAIAPNQEIDVRLSLDSDDLAAAGYRLFLYYPAH